MRDDPRITSRKPCTRAAGATRFVPQKTVNRGADWQLATIGATSVKHRPRLTDGELYLSARSDGSRSQKAWLLFSTRFPAFDCSSREQDDREPDGAYQGRAFRSDGPIGAYHKP